MIRLAGNLMTALVALAHLGFLALEMFFWNHPVGKKNIRDDTRVRNRLLVAGIFGGLTAKIMLLFTQTLPGAIALLLVIAARPEMRDKTS